MAMGSMEDNNPNNLLELGLTPAMITALFHKPHDRQFVIELENSIASFVNSNAESYELRPMNSYYRLLSHQVAEYHNLKHALARTHDNCVIIFKGDGFENMQGKPFLQDLQPMGFMSYGSANVSANNSTNNKRYRILKRRDDQSHSDKDGNNSNDNNDGIKSGEEQGTKNKEYDDEAVKASLEQQRLEKEKKYEQKKQEIFSTPKLSDDDDEGDDNNNNDNDNEEENGILDNSSPQPYQFETSRYRFNSQETTQQQSEQYSQMRPHRQHDYANGYTNNHTNGNVNGNGRRNRKYHSFDNDPRRSSSNAAPQFQMPYFMYPTPPMAAANAGQPPPQFPIMYPAPFPVDGSNGYLAPFMYQPMPGFAPMAPKSGVTSAPTSGPYMTYPLPYPYGQLSAPPPPSSMMYRQFSTPHKSHGPRYPKYGRNNSRSSFSRRSTEGKSSQDDTLEGNSSTSTMASAATEVDELSEDMQKLI